MKMRKWLKDLSDGLKNAGNEMAGELKHMGAHGAHEFASALLGGSAYVLYPREVMMIHRKNNLKSKGRCEMVTLCLIAIVWVAANNWWKRYLTINHPEQAERLQEVERQRKEARHEMFKKRSLWPVQALVCC